MVEGIIIVISPEGYHHLSLVRKLTVVEGIIIVSSPEVIII